ncbi:MAG: hypothetical protein AAF698_07435, partial [Pseudomonadota bacterium]
QRLTERGRSMARRGWLILGLILYGQADVAEAAFGDCTEPAYLRSVLGVAPAADFDCEEAFRIAVPTASGSREVRAIYDAGAPPSASLIASTRRAVEQSRDALAAFGSVDIHDTTILLATDTVPEGAGDADDPDGDEATAVGSRRDAAGPRECKVAVFANALAGSPTGGAAVIAHELFHCVQFASLSPGQMPQFGPGGDEWWVEGSAEFFAAFAIPGSGTETNRGPEFDAAVRADTPLYDMGYGAMVFFSWLIETRGPGALMPFLRAMAESTADQAQRSAMRRALDGAGWLDFAKAVADDAISHPQGGRLGLTRDGDYIWEFTDNGTQTISLPPFVLRRGALEYACGEWRNTTTPADPPAAARPQDGDVWGRIPPEVDTEETTQFRFAGLSTGDEPVELAIEAERVLACEPCGETRAVDACLVGTWRMSGGGPIEWMRSQGLPITSAFSTPRIVQFLSDGIYATEPFDTGLTMELDEDAIGEAEAQVAVAVGRWSAEEGVLNICQDSGGLSGQMTARTPSGSTTRGISQPGMGTLTQSYSCARTSLTTSLPFRGMAPMTTEYTRIGPARGR